MCACTHAVNPFILHKIGDCKNIEENARFAGDVGIVMLCFDNPL